MGFFRKLKRKWVSCFAPKDQIARELFYLQRAYNKTANLLDYYWSLPQPICCHRCAYPCITKLEERQERRLKHIEELKKLCDKKDLAKWCKISVVAGQNK
jgi:hypothetical protein